MVIDASGGKLYVFFRRIEMKFGKFLLSAIVGCMAFVSSASAQFPVPLVDNVTITNYCQVKPNGNVHTIIFSTLAPGF